MRDFFQVYLEGLLSKRELIKLTNIYSAFTLYWLHSDDHIIIEFKDCTHTHTQILQNNVTSLKGGKPGVLSFK